MAKIGYPLRFYRMHDLDLYTFVDTHQFNVTKAVYSALKAFAKGELFVIEVPERRPEEAISHLRVRGKKLFLDTEKDAEVIEMLNRVNKGYRNNFMKNVLRLYLQFPATEEFFDDPDDIIKFKEKYAIFREGRRQVKAGKLGLQKKYIAQRAKKQKETDDSGSTIAVPTANSSDDDVIQPPDAFIHKESEAPQNTVTVNQERLESGSPEDEIKEQEADELTAMFLSL